jgi:IS30 family transposase
MLQWRMPLDPRESITEEQWRKAADSYELGTKHASEIARDLGVSPATVSREFKRRGCVKACRVEETVADLKAALDAKAKREARRQAAQEAAALERSAELDRLVSKLMRSVMAASKAGDLTLANPTIAEVTKSLGVKPQG